MVAKHATRDIPGVTWGRVTAHVDDRGSFREIWRASEYRELLSSDRAPLSSFVQANLSQSQTGVLRGLHYHKRQFDHWVVLSGEIFVALVDLRGRDVDLVTSTLSDDDTVAIPAMVAHGFLALRRTTLLYLVTNEYDGSDEHGIAWNDPAIGVDWPMVATPGGVPIVSERDARNPQLSSVLRSRELGMLSE